MKGLLVLLGIGALVWYLSNEEPVVPGDEQGTTISEDEI